jgi:pyruvate kinase
VELAHQLEELRDEMRRRHVELAPTFERMHPCHRRGAANLVDYLTLRHHDMRRVQEALAELGLSSLGRAEEHVVTSIERVLTALQGLTGQCDGRRTEAAVGFGEGRRALEHNAARLLGPSRRGRATRILVTLPSEAAESFPLVRALMEHGMDCARINCAHDDEEHWGRMVEHLRRASAELGRACPILMDLPGPKLRTGSIEEGPRVLRLRPPRDSLGRPVAPVSALLVAEGDETPSATSSMACIPVSREWLSGLRPGDVLRLRDTRNSPRSLVVTSLDARGAWIASHDTTYLATGTRLVAPDGRSAAVGLLPPLVQALVLRPGDVVTLSADPTPASPVGVSSLSSAEASPPDTALPGAARGPHRFRLGCSLPQVLGAVRPGDRVFFDDGKIGGAVLAVRSGEADVRITTPAPKGSKLRAEKGINLPDSDLQLPALDPADDPILRFIVRHADLVGLSFAQHPADVAALQHRLQQLGGSGLGIVLKVETARGFAALPELLLAAMESERVGLMVARGDLAVECGFERLAEVQEEMLWLCDSAHVPVIWATEVLDQMARTGRPSRAEVSDAAVAGRAECVMLNKGPHIVEAVAGLDDILRRMSGHQRKKTPLLRRLRSWSPDPD